MDVAHHRVEDAAGGSATPRATLLPASAAGNSRGAAEAVATRRSTVDRVVAVMVTGSAIPRVTRKRRVVARERLIRSD